jgi:hypothetical protein
MMVTNSTVNVYIFGNITRGNGLSINDFDSFWVFQLVIGKIVLVGKFIIYEGKCSLSIVNQGMGINS